MEKIVIGFLGCGNIGCGVYRLLQTEAEQMEKNHGVSFELRRILVRSVSKKRNWPIPQALLTERAEDVLEDPEISMVMEFMGGEEPAASYMIRALSAGKTVITANKMALALHWDEITQAAHRHAAGLYYEASVCGAIPIIRVMNESMQGNPVRSIMGIINGTTNYILSRMDREGASYKEVLTDAQRLGLAEPDPTADVEGFDAAYKLSILSTLAFHRHVPVEAVYREGITAIEPIDVQCGRELGLTLKLLAISKEENGAVKARVHPTFIPQEHPLASVQDAFNAVYVDGMASGEMMFYGRGAGDLPTASALVSDLVKAAKTKQHLLPAVNDIPVSASEDWQCGYYVRLRGGDEPDVLSEAAEVFSKEGIGISRMIQKDAEEGFIQMVFLTDTVSEQKMREAIGKVDKSRISVCSLIRIEK